VVALGAVVFVVAFGKDLFLVRSEQEKAAVAVVIEENPYLPIVGVPGNPVVGNPSVVDTVASSAAWT